MKNIQTLRFTLLVFVFQFAVSQLFAQNDQVVAYLTITGSRSGQIKGSSALKGSEGKIECTGYSFAIKNSVNIGSAGAGVGKVLPTTIQVTKHIDKATPILMQAAMNGEILTSVVIDIYKQAADGMTLTQTIQFKTATINSITQSAGANATNKSAQPGEALTITAAIVQLNTGTTTTGGAGAPGGPVIKQPVKVIKTN